MSGGSWDASTCACNNSCDPTGQQEMSCYSEGGVWDSAACACANLANNCDPSGAQQANCEAAQDTWDPFNCRCEATSVCAYDDEQIVGYRTEYISSCNASGDITDCIDQYTMYKSCPDVSSPTCQCSEWEEFNGSDCTTYGGNCDWLY